jgi:tRNA-specific 2-thiouridylase
MKKTVAVALSGGLDSSVAALLLKNQAHHVIGIHFHTGLERHRSDGPCRRESRQEERARHMAEQIGIEFRTVDCSAHFQRTVVGYFVEGYARGQTPSPCVVCNHEIKFGVLLETAKGMGASALATGHYARIAPAPNGRAQLMKGADHEKDQSYFLSRLTQSQLKQALFPLGDYTKAEVRRLAEAQELASFPGRESQELCFVNGETYAEFLVREGNLSVIPGPIVDLNGQVVGRHRGLHCYTIGQRRGIGVPAGEAYYVISIDPPKNALVVGPKSALKSHQCTVVDVNWIGIDPPSHPLLVKTRLRYRHREAASVLTPIDNGRVSVVFSGAQEAVSPGQAAVFYRGESVLGGGWIGS